MILLTLFIFFIFIAKTLLIYSLISLYISSFDYGHKLTFKEKLKELQPFKNKY